MIEKPPEPVPPPAAAASSSSSAGFSSGSFGSLSAGRGGPSAKGGRSAQTASIYAVVRVIDAEYSSELGHKQNCMIAVLACASCEQMPPPAARARPPQQQQPRPYAHSSSSSSSSGSIGQAARNGVQSSPAASLPGAYRPAISSQAADMFSLQHQAPQQQQHYGMSPADTAAAAGSSDMLDDDAMLITEDHEQEALAASLFDFDSELGDTGV
eukprot:9448-Heterococcus_DN1.PRE.3